MTTDNTRLSTGAKEGLDPTPETILEGSVRMEQHPDYTRTLAEIGEQGFDLSNTQDDPYVVIKEVLNPEGVLIRVEKIVYVREGMRYLDLEHELGHIRQLTERFAEKPLLTDRVVEYPDGRVKDMSTQSGVMTTWQSIIIEYHNRLGEFLRLYERGANYKLLREHAQGIRDWREQYREKGLKGGRSPSRKFWTQEHFEELAELEKLYQDAGGYEFEQ